MVKITTTTDRKLQWRPFTVHLTFETEPDARSYEKVITLLMAQGICFDHTYAFKALNDLRLSVMNGADQT